MADTALNVSFLKGTQSKLDTLSAYQAGAFYLTEDTDRLYFAQSANELVYLNRYIMTVSKTTDLPPITDVSVGDFYYVANSNILCTKASTDAPSWTQINPPDTNDDTALTDATFSAAAEGDNIVVTYSLAQTKKDVKGTATPLNPITGTFTIKGSDIGSVVTNIALDVNATVASNTATVKLNGEGVATNASGFTISGGNNVTISGDKNAITVAAEDTTYTMSSPANTTDIILKDDAGTTNTVNIAADNSSNSSITVTGAAENKILIEHKDYTYSKAALSAQTPANGGAFNIVSGVTLENGHVTGVSTNTVTLPNMTHKIKSINAGADGKIYVSLVDYNGTAIADSATASGKVLYYKIGDATVYNQGDLGEHFYTKEEIDNTLKDANAMTFRGDVGSKSVDHQTLPTSGVKAGDTYIVNTDTAVDGGEKLGYTGDLFIASGTEGDDGYLTNINWIHVPSGDEIDTTYTFSFVKDKGLAIKNVASGSTTYLAISGGTAINVSTDGTLTISHADVDRNDPTKATTTIGSGTKVTVVTGVTSNAQGHVTAVATSELTMPTEDTYRLDGNTANTVYLKDKNGNNDGTLTIKADTGKKIIVTSSGTNTTADFKIAHDTASPTTTPAQGVTLAPSNASSGTKTFTVVTGITDDGYGHLDNITTTTYTMPKNSTYTLSGATVTSTGAVNTIGGTATVVDTLKDDAGTKSGTSTFALKSSTMSVSASGTTITADLIWGSF